MKPFYFKCVYVYINKLIIRIMQNLTVEQMEQALRDINFFVGGLTDEGIVYYYNKLIA